MSRFSRSASQLLGELGIGGVTLKLNTLGDAESRAAWRSALIEHFAAHRSELSARTARSGWRRTRCASSTARIRATGRSPIAAPTISLSPEAEDFFGQVRAGLDAAGVAYELDPHLVRGLDYYRHTAFEFVTDRLGAQGTVIAGGRYDGLVEQLGGPHTPAIGWAAGIERLAMLIDAPAPEVIDAAIVVEDDAALASALASASRLAVGGLSVELVATRLAAQAISIGGQEGRARNRRAWHRRWPVTRRVKSNDEPRAEALLAGL